MPEEKEFRKIIHVDMDAFYASVEQIDFPELKGKPLAVGGSRERGVFAAASYEARAFGVHSALASSIAARRCPDLIFVKPRFDRYKEISSQIMEIFKSYTDLVEPLSLDEAYAALGLPGDCTESELKKTYRAKAADFHPDKLSSKNLPNEFIEFANDQLARVNQAYEVIRVSRGFK